jgi:hypothetical protein
MPNATCAPFTTARAHQAEKRGKCSGIIFALALDGGAWRISKMKLETYHQLGNRALLSAK